MQIIKDNYHKGQECNIVFLLLKIKILLMFIFETSGPKGIKLFMLNSAEHEIKTAHKFY